MTNSAQFTSAARRAVVAGSRTALLVMLSCGLAVLAGSAAQAQTLTTIHAFNGVNGAAPASGVTLRAGVLYGTTLCLQYCMEPGTVYQITPVGSNWYFTPISFFSAGGSLPEARVVFGPDNRLYGTTTLGGPRSYGVVFSLTPLATICKTANCFSTEKVLYQFMGSPDGEEPVNGDLLWDPMGNIYGTTNTGGTSNVGTVFQLTKSGNDWTEAAIYSFTGPDGEAPIGGVILDSKGNLFGTTAIGGLYGDGTVFELTYDINSGWTETVLYSFQNQSDGWVPWSSLVEDGAGNLYGTTSDGGAGGGGTVFELSPIGNSWAFNLLYSFTGQRGKQCGPLAALSFDSSGSLYGTTACDGANSMGNVFKLTNTQKGWQYTSLYDFTGDSDGQYPVSNVTIDTDGTLYGTAQAGGDLMCGTPVGCGTVWMIKP